MSQIDGENLKLLEQRYRTTVLIVLAQIFVVLLLVFAGWFGFLRLASNLTDQDLTTLWIAVMFIAVGSFIMRRMFFSWERLKNIALLRGVPGLLGNLQRNSIILGVFAVVVASLGLLITAFSANGSDMLRAGAISLVVFLINFPRKKVWKTILANLEKV